LSQFLQNIPARKTSHYKGIKPDRASAQILILYGDKYSNQNFLCNATLILLKQLSGMAKTCAIPGLHREKIPAKDDSP
jgi:hypothetical protein